MEDKPSILEKIISSKETSEMEQFHPAEVILQLMKELTSKEGDIVSRRYRLTGAEEQTLEQIGKAYLVTRERVRQIEKGAIAKMKKGKQFVSLMHTTERTMMSVLTRHGGIMEEEALLRDMLSFAGQSQVNRNAVLFLMEEMLNEKFSRLPESAEYRAAWKLRLTSLDFTGQIVAELLRSIDGIGVPSSFDAIYERLQTTPFFSANGERLQQEVVNAVMGLSKQIDRNPFDEYGRSSWGSVLPKRMNDKIYLILKKAGKPLHFVEITRLINEAGFDHRTAYPPTVHNELILNDQYVLIGRGIYALREWGYEPGVVADVLRKILQNANRPMSRQELVDAVFKQRMVKKNTIHLALTDKKSFQRREDGLYELAPATQPTAEPPVPTV